MRKLERLPHTNEEFNVHTKVYLLAKSKQNTHPESELAVVSFANGFPFSFPRSDNNAQRLLRKQIIKGPAVSTRQEILLII